MTDAELCPDVRVFVRRALETAPEGLLAAARALAGEHNIFCGPADQQIGGRTHPPRDRIPAPAPPVPGR